MSPNLKAYLDTLAWAEIGTALLKLSDNGYNVCVGSTPRNPILFRSYAAHPFIRSDMGTPNDKSDDSDAAGRYQFMGRYWAHYKKQLALPDFGPASQDKWAIQLIRECRALDLIEAGKIADALHACRSRWASLPGAGYGQPEKKLEALLSVFVASGGVLA